MSDEPQTVEPLRSMSALLAQQPLGQATTLVSYVSAGHCLIIGDIEASLGIASHLDLPGVTVVSIDAGRSGVEKQLTDSGVAVFVVPELQLDGYLGAFRATAVTGRESLDLAVSVHRESGCFDLVLDLSGQPLMAAMLPPFGYRHAPDSASREAAIADLGELVGEFEKPRYFNYDQSICAHSRSELDGCNNCLAVCATGAIRPAGEGVVIDPHLCQGCGSCTTVCPSGAMRYAYPPPADAIERTRSRLGAGRYDTILLTTEAAAEQTDEVLQRHPEGDAVLHLEVEEVSAFGPDYWLTMMNAGISRVLILYDAPATDLNRQAMTSQQAWLHALLATLDIGPLVTLLTAAELANPDAWPARDASLSAAATTASLAYATHNDKRQTIRQSLDVLAERFAPVQPVTSLAAGAPFGRIAVDEGSCTLCMACVSTCPANALLDGQDTPALRLVEANCLQCGLCATACPESAITLVPQYTWDSMVARQIETLHKEEPFHCISCHAPFATNRIIQTMTARLGDHWMFGDQKAMRRLQMCGDCRVKDIFRVNAGGIKVHRDNTPGMPESIGRSSQLAEPGPASAPQTSTAGQSGNREEPTDA